MHIFKRALIPVVIVAAAGLLAGCGGTSGSTAAVPQGGATRTVDVTMTDNAYQPAQLQVAKGETVTLRFKNSGSVRHEALIGDAAAQAEHHSEMSSGTASGDMNMGGHGGMEPSSDKVTVEPGKTGEITHMFNESGTVLIGCHEPGHWESGMKSTVTVG